MIELSVLAKNNSQGAFHMGQYVCLSHHCFQSHYTITHLLLDVCLVFIMYLIIVI
jgi:hypothetical protein